MLTKVNHDGPALEFSVGFLISEVPATPPLGIHQNDTDVSKNQSEPRFFGGL
jgi:hypothetical protein